MLLKKKEWQFGANEKNCRWVKSIDPDTTNIMEALTFFKADLIFISPLSAVRSNYILVNIWTVSSFRKWQRNPIVDTVIKMYNGLANSYLLQLKNTSFWACTPVGVAIFFCLKLTMCKAWDIEKLYNNFTTQSAQHLSLHLHLQYSNR